MTLRKLIAELEKQITYEEDLYYEGDECNQVVIVSSLLVSVAGVEKDMDVVLEVDNVIVNNGRFEIQARVTTLGKC
jgi:hypothetical protein